jgi:hypothetical protein
MAIRLGGGGSVGPRAAFGATKNRDIICPFLEPKTALINVHHGVVFLFIGGRGLWAPGTDFGATGNGDIICPFLEP